MHFNASQCESVQLNATQCNSIQLNATQCDLMQLNATKLNYSVKTKGLFNYLFKVDNNYEIIIDENTFKTEAYLNGQYEGIVKRNPKNLDPTTGEKTRRVKHIPFLRK